MKYGEEGNMNSSNPKPAPVGIIKKSSLYRGPQLLKQPHHAINNNNEANAVVNINCDDLTVVGYSSNLYRDDFMALKLESRDILIPWNGDENLLIDRYDCRGYLYDLEPYDADLMANERRNPKYTSEEVEIEQACDAERYMFLRDDDNDEQQTELDNNDNANNNRDSDTDDNSRLYACVGFNYDSKSQHQKETDKNGTHNNDAASKELEQQPKEKLFVPDDALQLPLGMLIPETVKMNQIVMKTASFVAKQGLQMEILLKTKQANNTQFDFLNFDNHLNPYYKHLIQLIRDNKIDPMVYLIEPKEEVKPEKNDEQDSDDENASDDDNYLHPLLFKKIESTEKKKEPEENKTIDETSNASKEEDSKSNEVKMEEEEGLVEEAANSKQREHEADEKFEEPPEGVEKTIIDKLAEYVSRNGREFEKTMLKKDEKRFGFVKNDHRYYKYYCMMVEKAIKSIGELSRGGGIDEKTKEEVIVKEKSDENNHTSSKRAVESSSEDSEKESSGSSSSSGSDSESDGAKDRDKEKETKKDKEKTRKRSRERSRERGDREKKRKKEKKSHSRSKSSSHHHRHHHHHKSEQSSSSSSSKSKKKHHHRKKSKSRH